MLHSLKEKKLLLMIFFNRITDGSCKLPHNEAQKTK